MAATTIAHQRLNQQRLTYNPFTSPEEVVSWLGAVQAQDYQGAKWSLGLRMQKASDAAIEQAFNAGAILRTHIMRPTWHFVAPADIRWIQELTAARVKAVNAYMYRQNKLDAALFERTNAVIAKALQGGHMLTRLELGVVLADAGIAATGMRLLLMVHQAELDAVVCSGPRRGKQFTYMLLEERAPQARILRRDEALADLTLRYYTGHGPATLQDFVWWSGLTSADAKAGLDLVGTQLAQETIDSQTYWFSPSLPPAGPPANADFLLPTFDEFLIGYSSFDKSRKGGMDTEENSVFFSTLVIGGQVAGSWRRTLKKGSVVIQTLPYTPLSPAASEVVRAAAQRYGEFLGLSVEMA